MISIFMITQKPADTALDRVHAQINRADNLVSMFVNPSNGRLKTGTITLGARADSYYEYLLKLWIQSGKKDDKYVGVLCVYPGQDLGMDTIHVGIRTYVHVHVVRDTEHGSVDTIRVGVDAVHVGVDTGRVGVDSVHVGVGAVHVGVDRVHVGIDKKCM